MNYDNFDYERKSASAPHSELLEGLRTQDTRPIRRVFSRVGFGIATFAMIYVLASNLIVILLHAFDLSGYVSKNVGNMFLSAFSIYVIALPALVLIFRGAPASPPEKKKFGIGKFIIAACVCLGLTYIGALVGNGFMSVISKLVGYDYSNSLNSVVFGDDLLISSLYTIIMAPIGEEFVYRKLLIDRTRRYGALPSIIISGLMFGLMHGNFYQFFYATMLGMVFAYIYYNYGKIHITMFLHMFVNFMGSIIPALMITDFTNISFENFDIVLILRLILTFVHSLALFGYMGFAVVFVIIAFIKFKNRPAEIDIPKKKFFPTVFLTPGVLMCFLVFAAYFVLYLLPR